MKKKQVYSFNDFLIANTTKPWLIFNDIDEEINSYCKKNISLLQDDISYEDDEDDLNHSEYDFLDFYTEEIENIVNDFTEKNLENEEKEKISKLNSFEKIDFLKQYFDSTKNLEKKQFDEETYKNINYLFSIFTNINILSTGIEKVYDQGVEQLINFYKEKYGLNDNQIKFISLKQTQEDMLSQTEKALKQNYRLIINPVFKYKDCLSKVTFLDTTECTFGNLIYSKKTTRKQLLKSYWDFKIINNFLKINEIFLFKPKYQKRINVKKGTLYFTLTKYCYYSKSGASISSKNKKELSEEEIEAKLVGDPNFDYSSKRKSKSKENKSIIDHVLAELTSANYNFHEKRLGNLDTKKTISNYTCSFDEFLNLIKNKDNIKVDWELSYDDFIDNFNSNMFFSKLFQMKYPNYKVGSKKILKLVANVNDEVDVLTRRKALEFYDNNLISIAPNIEELYEYKVINDKEAKIAWFDFEGVTLPTPMIDYLPAWNQVISQTSIIKTQNNEIYESNDYVYDPKDFGIDTYKKIVDDLYDEEISYYIIYNISYERARLIEIKEALEIYWKKTMISDEDYQLYLNKIDFIINRLVDICNFFLSHMKKVFVIDRPINIGYINGAFSIKKIEYFVTENKLGQYLRHNIKPYAELNVKNGSSALIISTSRALNFIKDNEWNEKIKDLKIYCHNDVMAMLMAADLIKYLMKNKKEYLKNYEKYDV